MSVGHRILVQDRFRVGFFPQTPENDKTMRVPQQIWMHSPDNYCNTDMSLFDTIYIRKHATKRRIYSRTEMKLECNKQSEGAGVLATVILLRLKTSREGFQSTSQACLPSFHVECAFVR